MAHAEQERKIQEFAVSQRWTAAILDAGFITRAIFQKPETGIGTESISISGPEMSCQ
jgi:hypothetical protein